METLALIELLDRDGQPRQAVRVTEWPVRIGRAIDCDVVLDDPHVAPYHASLIEKAGGVHVEPAPSLNGVRLGRARIASDTAALSPESQLQLGNTVLRVRLASAVPAPELPLADTSLAAGRRAAWLAGLAVVAGLWAGFDQWVSSAPGEAGSEITALYLGAPIALALWCSLWALGSKLFQHQFAFWPHLGTALFWLLMAMASQSLAGQLAFAFSAPILAKLGHLLAVGALGMLIWRHLSIVLPQRRRACAVVVVAMLMVGGGLDLAERVRHQQPLVGDLYLSTISLPGLRVARPVSAQAFVQSAAPLEHTLSRWARQPGDESTAESEDDDD